MKLNPNLFTGKQERKSTRDGFGEGLLEAAKRDRNIYALTADLAESTRVTKFREHFPTHFVQVGVAEQNLVSVAAGLARAGKVPFITSFAVFNPGRNWEQIRTTVCYNDVPVKIVGSHSGLGVGEDGATHQALEDIALMRVLPNMQVIVPCDAIQAKKATMAIAKSRKPAYLRVNRQSTPIITNEDTPFEIGKAEVMREGKDVTIIACGPLVYEALKAAEELKKGRISAEVINCHTIKPLDEKTIIASARKTKRVVTAEDHQISGGLGGAVAELLSEKCPVKILRVGMNDQFGESGEQESLYKKYGINHRGIINAVNSARKKRQV